MPPKVEEILRMALRLTEEERTFLTSLLVDSLEAPLDDPKDVDDFWKKEVERRIEDLESGKVKAMTWEEAWQRITGSSRGSNESTAA